jgi:hypothetical protein
VAVAEAGTIAPETRPVRSLLTVSRREASGSESIETLLDNENWNANDVRACRTNNRTQYRSEEADMVVSMIFYPK